MSLSSLDPNPSWDPDAYTDELTTLNRIADDITINIWGADWCSDCRRVLPDFGAALQNLDLDSDQVNVYPVTQEKEGPLVDEYEIDRIPTIVLEYQGEEIGRFVENEKVPAIVYFANRIEDIRTIK
ncbi:MAG: TlpA family protein disulfide reductase [Halobacteriaceae archaeon]